MSHEHYINNNTDRSPASPGSFEEFRTTLEAKVGKVTETEVLGLYGIALSDFRQQLADRQGVTVEDLHHGLSPEMSS